MSWKKYFRSVPVPGSNVVPGPGSGSGGGGAGTSSNFSSFLPEVYAGHPNRIQRYYQYDDMDRDSDINAALDTIADFCTQSEEQSDQPFDIIYTGEVNETEVELLKEMLNKWIKLNDFRSRLWHIFRNVIKYGDQFFVRDPETGELEWIDPFSVELVKVDEENGKDPDEYIVRGLDFNKRQKLGCNRADPASFNTGYGPVNIGASGGRVGMGAGSGAFALSGQHIDPRTRSTGLDTEAYAVDAQHVVHMTLSVNMDINWPFGSSVLEPVYKTFKQKELLEDAIIIYRVQRAPERRIFKIDVGNMPPARAKAHLEQIKNEIHQRRIPSRTGGGSSVMDAAYNPLSMMDDFFFAQTSEGRGSSVETLAGGDQVGEITDLTFFTKKMARGLKIPTSYLPMGDEQQQASYQDGKVGTAMIQEFRFNKYCMRIQSALAPVCDTEFKLFLSKSGVEIDENSYELRFNPPQNFSKYRQIEIDAAQAAVYGQVQGISWMSERYKAKRYLGMAEDQILENERMYSEENPTKIKKATGATAMETMPGAGLGSVGLAPGMDGGFDMGGDGMDAPLDGEGEGGDMAGDAGAPPMDAGAAPAGGAPPPPAPPPPA